MGKIYGFFSYPEMGVSYFAPTTEEVVLQPLTEEGGCLFSVKESFIEYLEKILNHPGNAGLNVFVEISGDDDTIFADPATDGLIGIIVLPDLDPHECAQFIQKHRRFKSTFFSRILPFSSFKETFQIRKLN